MRELIIDWIAISLFKEGFFYGLIINIINLIIIFYLFFKIFDYVSWSKIPIQKYESAILLNCNYKASSALASAKYVTVWNLGDLGRVICEKEKVYRFAKPKSDLMIKISSVDDEIEIIDICKR